MAFQAVPDTAKVAVVMQYSSEDLINVFHFRRTTVWGLPELESLLETVGTVWVNDIMIHLSQYVYFLRVEGRGLRAIDDVSAEYVLSTPVIGSRGNQGVPANVAFAITHLTGRAGRSFRGRTFFGGFSEDDVDRSLLVSARADGLRNGLVSLRNVTSQLGWTQVVVSRYENRQRRPVGVTIPVTGFRYRDNVVDSQRRRLPGRGT